MKYFSPAVQLGLTATPSRDVIGETYKYFGDPVYIYSLKEGVSELYDKKPGFIGAEVSGYSRRKRAVKGY